MPEQTQSVKKFPTEIIELPSKGLLYPENHPLANGKIELKYMTAKEEDILSTTSYINQGIVLDKLFESMIITKVNYDDILLGDKNAIMIAARRFGYGEQYDTVVKTDSGKEIPISINLSEVPYKEFDETQITPHINKFEYILPKSENKITFKLLTAGDKKKIDADLKGLKKLGRQRTETNLTTRLKYMIVSVDGSEDKKTINEFVDNMLAIDARAFRQHVSDISPDIDLTVTAEDPDTGAVFQNDFELGIDLFYPDFKG